MVLGLCIHSLSCLDTCPDKKGIEAAQPMVGMNKQGVLIAIGYPSEFVVTDPKAASSWQYWRDRWGKFVVIFDQQGRVKDISGRY